MKAQLKHMKINITRKGTDFGMEARNEEGCSLLMDSAPDFGGSGQGMRPMQLLLSALGGCSTIDVITILKKQKQQVASIEIDVEGAREKTNAYSLFRSIHLHFKIDGAVDRKKADAAIKLSLGKYCSVAKTLEPTAAITYTLTLNGHHEKQTV